MAIIHKVEPVVIDKAKDILLGEGVVYVNYGEAGEAILGATLGGSKLEIEQEIRPLEHDGMLGNVKNKRRPIEYKVKLIVNLLKLSYTNIPYGLNVTVSDGTDSDGTYKEMTFDTDFNASDVLDNVTFKGYTADGKFTVITVKNAFNIDSVELDFKEKIELSTELIYNGFYLNTTPSDPPIHIDVEN